LGVRRCAFAPEHDTYSEQKLRWMGRGMSTTLAPLLALAKRRMCRGRLAFKPAPHAPPVRRPPADAEPPRRADHSR